MANQLDQIIADSIELYSDGTRISKFYKNIFWNRKYVLAFLFAIVYSSAICDSSV